VIVRPRVSNRAELVQLDDLNPEQARRIAPHAFMVLATSPGNCQAWGSRRGRYPGLCPQAQERRRSRPIGQRRHPYQRQPQLQGEVRAGIPHRRNSPRTTPATSRPAPNSCFPRFRTLWSTKSPAKSSILLVFSTAPRSGLKAPPPRPQIRPCKGIRLQNRTQRPAVHRRKVTGPLTAATASRTLTLVQFTFNQNNRHHLWKGLGYYTRLRSPASTNR
jgi:hypothetical protein